MTSAYHPALRPLPQLHWRYTPLAAGRRLDASVEADATAFHAEPQVLTGQPNGKRSYAMAQISRPFWRRRLRSRRACSCMPRSTSSIMPLANG